MPNYSQLDPKAGYLKSGDLGYQPWTQSQGYRPSPQAILGGGYLPATQINPQQNAPLLAGQQGQQLKNIWKQVEPAAINLRNQNLSNLLNQMNTPMSQLYAAQATGQAAGGRVQGLDQLRMQMAQRGMIGQGAEATGKLGIESGYLQNVGGANLAAQGQENQRQQALLTQLMQIPQADLGFYSAIRGGAASMGQLFQNQDAEFWGKAAKGLGTAARSAISAGAGGGGASMGGGGGGGGGIGDIGSYGGSAFSAAGDYGMSYGGGMGGAAGDYGMSFGGGY